MPRTVLIVEDSEGTATALEIALNAINGMHVLILTSAREALKLLLSDPGEFAALITDIHMPYMDGFALIEEVRRHQCHSKLPILVISGDSHPDTPGRSLRLGADAYFCKPYSPSEIRHTLEGLLNAS
jgi:two-component system, chemotaxis family, sensor histidine kinase and response regulator PixL